MSTAHGANAAGALMGIAGNLGYGYIENLEEKEAVETEDVKNEDGEVVLHGRVNPKKKDISFDYVPYQTESSFANDEAVQAFGSGTQIEVPELSKKIFVNEITKKWEIGKFLRISCSGVIYDNINDDVTP